VREDTLETVLSEETRRDGAETTLHTWDRSARVSEHPLVTAAYGPSDPVGRGH